MEWIAKVILTITLVVGAWILFCVCFGCVGNHSTMHVKVNYKRKPKNVILFPTQ